MDNIKDFFNELPQQGYHAFDGVVKVFNDKKLSYNCGCGEEHTVNESIALIDFALMNKAVYLCPNNDNIFNLVKAKGLFSIKGLKTISSTKAIDDEDKKTILTVIEMKKRID